MGRGVWSLQLLLSLAPLLQRLVQANTWVVLRGLEPGVRYHIYQLRSKPDGTSMDGVWGPWSQALAAETPHSSGDIGLCCRTPDLRHVRCEWSWDPAEPHSSHQLLYRPPPSGAGTREDAWQQCEEVSRGAQGTYACTFQPKAGSAISVLVNVTRTHMLPTLSYFKEPFWLHQAVLTDAPQLVQATSSQGRLSLQWLPPLELPAEQLDYQVCYAMENSHDWKVLQVPRAARKEVLDLRPGSRYPAQVRAQPSGPWYRGSWSAGPKPVVVDAVADAGWLIPSVTVVPLLFSAALLGLRCTFPSLYSNMKQKLWPPVPELHCALGSFHQESSKHGQADLHGLLKLDTLILNVPPAERGTAPRSDHVPRGDRLNVDSRHFFATLLFQQETDRGGLMGFLPRDLLIAVRRAAQKSPSSGGSLPTPSREGADIHRGLGCGHEPPHPSHPPALSRPLAPPRGARAVMAALAHKAAP
ncbi:LOW QUALITY PROTEIN: thrombopoietin receptor-like [Ammospiza maritima maritima]